MEDKEISKTDESQMAKLKEINTARDDISEESDTDSLLKNKSPSSESEQNNNGEFLSDIIPVTTEMDDKKQNVSSSVNMAKYLPNKTLNAKNMKFDIGDLKSTESDCSKSEDLDVACNNSGTSCVKLSHQKKEHCKKVRNAVKKTVSSNEEEHDAECNEEHNQHLCEDISHSETVSEAEISKNEKKGEGIILRDFQEGWSSHAPGCKCGEKTIEETIDTVVDYVFAYVSKLGKEFKDS